MIILRVLPYDNISVNKPSGCCALIGEAEELRRPSADSRPAEHASRGGMDNLISRPQSAADISAAADVSLPGLRAISVGRVPSAGPNRPGAPQWLVFNDFSVSPASFSEVTQLYGLQKIPCLLYYTQVRHPDAAVLRIDGARIQSLLLKVQAFLGWPPWEGVCLPLSH